MKAQKAQPKNQQLPNNNQNHIPNQASPSTNKTSDSVVPQQILQNPKLISNPKQPKTTKQALIQKVKK